MIIILLIPFLVTTLNNSSCFAVEAWGDLHYIGQALVI